MQKKHIHCQCIQPMFDGTVADAVRPCTKLQKVKVLTFWSLPKT